MNKEVSPIPRHEVSRYILVGGQVLKNVHDSSLCAGRYCCIHNPSDHSMKKFPQNFRMDRGFMERVCPHGVGHPDPDDPYADPIHGCDGCCAEESS